MFFISPDQKAGYGVAKDMLAKDGHNVESMEKLSKLLMDKVDSLRVTCHRVNAIAGKWFLELRTRTMARHIEETSGSPESSLLSLRALR